MYRQFNLNEPCWSPANATPARTSVSAFICPSATGGCDGFEVQRTGADNAHGTPIVLANGSKAFFAHSHYITNAGIHQPWGRTTPYCYDYDVPEPVSSNGNQLARIEGPFYRNSKTTVAGVPDGWPVTEAERVAVASFLFDRRNRMISPTVRSAK